MVFLFVTGHALGTISMLDVKGDGGSIVKTLGEHKDAITDIASGILGGQPIIASADMAGAIFIRDQQGNAVATIASPAGYSTLSSSSQPFYPTAM